MNGSTHQTKLEMKKLRLETHRNAKMKKNKPNSHNQLILFWGNFFFFLLWLIIFDLYPICVDGKIHQISNTQLIIFFFLSLVLCEKIKIYSIWRLCPICHSSSNSNEIKLWRKNMLDFTFNIFFFFSLTEAAVVWVRCVFAWVCVCVCARCQRVFSARHTSDTTAISDRVLAHIPIQRQRALPMDCVCDRIPA